MQAALSPPYFVSTKRIKKYIHKGADQGQIKPVWQQNKNIQHSRVLPNVEIKIEKVAEMSYKCE